MLKYIYGIEIIFDVPNMLTGGSKMAKKRGRKSVSVKSYSYTRRGKRIHVKGYKRSKAKR